MERNLQKTIQNWVKKQPDVWLVKYHGSIFSMRGHPDLFGNVGPFSIYVELKKPGKNLESLQAVIGRRIRQTGAMCVRCEDFGAFVLAVEKLRKMALDVFGESI